MSERTIKSIWAREVYTRRTFPGVEAIVITEGGHEGRAVCVAGHSVGTHEVKFSYDNHNKWHGRGVMCAVENVNNVIGPALIGLDASEQHVIDQAMLSLRPDAKAEMGGNAIAAVSAAVLKAGAASLGIPLYRHIGGENAMYLPVPGVPAFNGHERWGGGITTPGTKPTYDFVLHGFDTFSKASYAGWEMEQKWKECMEKFGVSEGVFGYYTIPKGKFESDEQIWALMSETIIRAGYEGRIGIQVDIASDTYYNRKDKKYYGLFSKKPQTSDDLMKLYIYAVKNYPFVIIEDPFFEDDYENHAELVKHIDIQIVGDDLFTTNIKRVDEGKKQGAANTILLKVNQIGTISEALEMVQFAYKAGYGVMPCESRGEGVTIADYCVGINACSVREMGTGEVANRFLEIERELGSKARFQGTRGLRGRRFESMAR